MDEGIEAMLCCWLQQLQEFGGPEVDKPDLLKGSIGSLRSHPQVKSAGSTSSLARNFLMDPKARYNVSTVSGMTYKNHYRCFNSVCIKHILSVPCMDFKAVVVVVVVQQL